MNRRTFLKGVIGAVAAGVGAKYLPAPVPPIPVPVVSPWATCDMVLYPVPWKNYTMVYQSPIQMGKTDAIAKLMEAKGREAIAQMEREFVAICWGDSDA